MKKIIALLLALLLCLSLTACGKSAQDPAATPAPTQAPAEETAAPAPTEAPAVTEAPAAGSDDRDIALGLIDSPVADLYAAIGEPSSSEYASSCLIDGEDGVLYYDGFTVYTLRYADGTETVYDVE